MWILTQKRDLFFQVTDVRLQNDKLMGVSPQHPMGTTIGKYDSPERARSVMMALVAEVKTAQRCLVSFEMPAG